MKLSGVLLKPLNLIDLLHKCFCSQKFHHIFHKASSVPSLLILIYCVKKKSEIFPSD